jgi:ABC-type antimicrobial peptide transport system permease subunit
MRQRLTNNQQQTTTPPKWADRFLQWYCRADLLEEIQGDAYELYFREVKENKRLADLQFIWNVLRFFRFKNISKLKLPVFMFRNYLLIGFRNALRNGLTSAINSVGLAVGIAGAITIFIFADQFLHTDDFQLKRDRIYEVTNVVNRDSRTVTLSDVPMALGEALQAQVPGIEKVVRMELQDGAVRVGTTVFSEQLYFVDTSFFDVFNFPFMEGNASALTTKKAIVLTQKMATKYFGDKACLGETVSIKFSADRVEQFTVTAVVDQPANNTIYFNFLLSIDVYFDLRQEQVNDWRYLTDGLFVLMRPGHTGEEMESTLKQLVSLQHESSPEWLTEKFKVFSYESLSHQSHEIESGLAGSGNPEGVYVLCTIAFVLLLLACFNYMNISVATVSTRLKEIGIRKVIGSSRQEIIKQFVVENFMLCSFSLLVGLTIAYFFFMPWLNVLMDYEIPFAFSSGQSMVYFFASLLVLIVIVSGVYPAVYISNFKPVSILKGKEKFGQRSMFSRVLLTVQFVLSFMTIVGCFVFIDNSFYLKDKDWGYSHEQNIVVPLVSPKQYLPLRDLVNTQKQVMSFAGSTDHIAWWNPRSSVEQMEQRYEIVSYKVGFDYLETMNVRLKAGRLFDKEIQSDKIESVVVNEKFVSAMGWQQPIGQTFEYDSVKRTIIGVVQNFHYDDFYRDILPVMFSIAPEENYKYLSIKVEAGNTLATEAWLREAWKKVAPDDPYEGALQDKAFSNWARNNSQEIKLLGFIASLATLLSCLGLFGLVSYNITRRLKEFSVRKIFGANTMQVFRLMSRDYVWILSIAFVIGAPTGFFLMNSLVHHIYKDPQTAGPEPFLIAVLLMILTVTITIGSQMKRVVKENPAKTLRME